MRSLYEYALCNVSYKRGKEEKGGTSVRGQVWCGGPYDDVCVGWVCVDMDAKSLKDMMERPVRWRE